MSRPPAPLLAGAFGLLCLIWGTTWAVIRIGLEGVPPFSGVAIRFGLASVVLLAAALAAGVRLGRTRVERRLWIANGLLSFSISYGVVYWAEQWVPSGLTAVLFATYPLFVAVFAAIALPSETLGRVELMGLAAAFAGVAVIFSEDLSALGGPDVRTAAGILLLSPVASAAGSVAVKRWGGGVHPLSITAIPMAITAAVMGAVALAAERGREFTWSASAIGAILYLSILGSVVTFSLYYWLLLHLPVRRLALIAYVVPVIAVAVGVARGEPLTIRILIGSSIVVGAVALAMQGSLGARRRAGPEAAGAGQAAGRDGILPGKEGRA